MRRDFLSFAQPDLDESELEEVRDVLGSGWLTGGPQVERFEADFAATVGARHAVAVNSCTAALHLALEAIELGPGDGVITSPYTFGATAEVVRYFNATPIFVDISARDLNIDVPALDAALRRGAAHAFHVGTERIPIDRVKAILPVHVGGQVCELSAISRLAGGHGMRVIEDAAHAFPARYGGHMIGSVSDFACFSFYATKAITTGEGGMICTNDDAWAARCRLMRLHGIDRTAWSRGGERAAWRYEIVAPGFKYNMTDVAAAMGLAQLRKAERMWKRRREIALRYGEAFAGVPELECPVESAEGEHAWHLYVLRLNLPLLAVGRDRFIDELHDENIGTSVHFIPLHLHRYYRDLYGYRPDDFPVANREWQRAISLPIYSRMTESDVDDVVAAVLRIIARHRRP